MTRLLAGATTVSALVLCLASAAPAQVYRWMDEQGRVNFSQGLDSVPERYRSGALRAFTSWSGPDVPIDNLPQDLLLRVSDMIAKA